jgi:nitroreductase
MDLLSAIMQRRSVRRYRDQPLDREMLAKIDAIVDDVNPLIPANRFRVMRRDVVTGEDLIAAMGGYGRILSPPHYLVGYTIGTEHPLVDLGFRMEQIAVGLVKLGISTCFIGSLGRTSNVRVRFRLSRDAHMGAFLIFGYPAENIAGRTINAMIRRAAGATNKLPVDEIFYHGDFDNPSTPPQGVATLLEAARSAPSADNAQPWRFLLRDGTLTLFVRRSNTRYGSKPVMQQYRYFDGGVCMSNVSMALRALEQKGSWVLLDPSSPEIPPHPDTLEPLARLER